MTGLLAYGAYVPHHRLDRGDIAAALGEGGGKGTRAVASFDEDATSMGVEAARIALRGSGAASAPQRVVLATAAPPYLDKTNANVVHAALDLDPSVLAFDAIGSVRSGLGAVVTALDSTARTLVVLADVRTGLPGGADERDGGDGAAALLFGAGTDDAPTIAEVLAVSSSTGEFLDRWRLPGEDHSHLWEERFGEHAYGPLADAAWSDALKQANLAPGDVDHLVVAGLHPRANRVFAAGSGVNASAFGADLTGVLGNAGVAQPGIALAAALDTAEPGKVIALVTLADGATVLLFRTTPALVDRRSEPSVATQIERGQVGLPYAKFLTWRGHLHREPPRRPDPTGPAAPPTRRNERWKFALDAARCQACDTLQMPPGRTCISCGAIDRMAAQRMVDVPATVVTYTIDRLAYSPNPPIVSIVVDFDGGGRFDCELTDVDPSSVDIGDRVAMTFRKVVTAGGIHNYFWKARPVAPGTVDTKEA